MTTHNSVQKTAVSDNHIKHQKPEYQEIEGVKLRDSLFLVYSEDNSGIEPEYIYNLMPIESTNEMIFDNSNNKASDIGGPENCGVYKLENLRVLNIVSMTNWHFSGYIFKDEESWKQF